MMKKAPPAEPTEPSVLTLLGSDPSDSDPADEDTSVADDDDLFGLVERLARDES